MHSIVRSAARFAQAERNRCAGTIPLLPCVFSMRNSKEFTVSQTQPEPRPGSAFSWNEDWLATVVGLVLIGLVLVGAIPDWLVP